MLGWFVVDGYKQKGTGMKADRPRIVVQDRDSLLYAQTGGHWTSDLKQSLNFVDLRSAHDYALETGRLNLEVVISFGERTHSVRIHPRQKPEE